MVRGLRWLRRRDPDGDLRDEMDTHLSLEADRQAANGLSIADAAAAARRKFGNPLTYREHARQLRSGAAFARAWLDLRTAIRALSHRPIGTTAAILALALAMGTPASVLMILSNISTAVFPLVRDPGALVMLVESPPNRPSQREPATDATWRVWRAQLTSVAGLSAAQVPLPLTLTWDDLPEPVRVQPISTTLLPLLGVSPAMGRAFVESDAAAGAAPVALISDGFWHARFGALDSAIGSTLTIDGRVHSVIGVMPQGFWITAREVDVWLPTSPEGFDSGRHFAIARLRPGDTRETLGRRLTALSAQIAAANPTRDAGWSTRVISLGADSILFDLFEQPGVILLVVATALALIVACANVAMLMVARGSARQKETAIRAALGVSRARLVRQFLLESTLVAVAGAAFALLVSFGALQVLAARASLELPVRLAVHMDWRVVASVLALATAVGILAGLGPALADSRLNLMAALKETGFFSSAPAKRRVRRGLIVGEVALTVMLLASVSLLVRGSLDLEQTPPGFDPDRLLRVALNSTRHFGRDAAPPPPFRQTLDRLRSLPEVETAAAVLVAAPGVGDLRIVTTHGTTAHEARATRELVNAVSSDFFTTLGLNTVRGQTFSASDGSADVAVVSLAFARRHWPERDPIGETLSIAGEGTRRRVVAVVSDQLLHRSRRMPAPVVFIPFTDGASVAGRRESLLLLARVSAPASQVVPRIRKVVADADPLQTVQVSSVKDVMAVGALEIRFGAFFATPLLLLALLLTISGIYGLLAQSLAERTHEVAIRLTLGASRGALLRFVAADAVTLSAVGAAVGIAAALVVDRFLDAFLLGVPGEQPLALAASALVLMLATLAAAMVPYRRALRIDSGRMLRYE